MNGTDQIKSSTHFLFIALYHLFFFFLEENVKIPSEVILLSAICFTSLRNLCYVIDISFCRLLLQLLGPFQHIKMKLASTIYLTCKLIGMEKQFLISAKSYKDHGRERRDSVSLIHMNRVNLKNIINILLANCNRTKHFGFIFNLLKCGLFPKEKEMDGFSNTIN